MTEFPFRLGNKASCSAQGFIVQSSIASPIYNAVLSLYYLLVIKYRWPDQKLKSVEKYMHRVPISFGIVTATIVLCLDMYNPAAWDCWIGPDVNISGQDNFDTRETLSHILKWSFFFIPLWVSMALSSVFMVSIYLNVREIEKRSLKWNVVRKKAGTRMKQTKAVSQQGSLYVIAFLVTWLFPTISRLFEIFGAPIPSVLIVLSGTLIPCQGFFNAMVYFRMRYQKCQKKYPDKTRLWLVTRIFMLTLCPCCEVDRHNVDDGHDVEYDIRKESESRASSNNTNSLKTRTQGSSYLRSSGEGVNLQVGTCDESNQEILAQKPFVSESKEVPVDEEDHPSPPPATS